MQALLRGAQWGVDRVLSVGYGLFYDYIYERFGPYRDLQHEVLELVHAGAGDCPDRHQHHVLDVGCGPGNFTVVVAEAGYSALGLDAYGALVDLAREKRRARRLAHLAFHQGDLTQDIPVRDESFDQVVSIHALYVHPRPLELLAQAHRVLRPGGHVIFVNHTRQVSLGSTFREALRRQGWRAALQCLVWLLPNAIFEATRRPVGPHYWDDEQFRAHLRGAGFTVLATRRTFLNGTSLLVWARKSAGG